MASNKSKNKTTKTAPKANNKPEPKVETQAKPQAKPTPKRKASAGAKVLAFLLLLFIGASVLVGLGIVKVPEKATDIKILGQDAYENQPRTPLVARSERPENMTETSIELLDAPDMPTPTKVEIKVNGSDDGNNAAVNAQIADLKQVIEAQQQMLRMVNQKQEQLMATHQVQMLKMGEAFNALRAEMKQADTASLEKHIARLYLLQGVDRLYRQWEDGILLPSTVEAWSQQASAGGFKEAQSLGLALSTLIKDNGLLNEQELYRRTVGLRSAYLAAQEAAEEAKAESGGFWGYIKAKFRSLIQISRVDETADLSDKLIAPLESGDIPTFWQVLSKQEGQDTTDLTTKLRQMVEAHTSQKYSFDTLYQALAIQPTKAKVAAVVVVTEEEAVAEGKPIQNTETPQEAAE